MKSTLRYLLSLSLLLSAVLPLPLYAAKSADKGMSNALVACKNLVNKSRTSIYADRFVASYGDAYRPATRDDYQKLIANTCFEGVMAAQKFASMNDLDNFLFAMRAHWNDILGADLIYVEEISRNYFRALHNIKEKDEISYPKLDKNASTEQKVAALEEFSNKKLIRGISIKRHCETITSSMPDKSKPSAEIKAAAMQVCQGVMAMNITNNKHGINASDARKIAEKTYQKGTIEYRYIDSTINTSFNESRE